MPNIHEIKAKALEHSRATTSNIEVGMYHFQSGARWANAENAKEIAELLEGLREIAAEGEQDIAPTTRDERIARIAKMKDIARELLKKYEQ